MGPIVVLLLKECLPAPPGIHFADTFQKIAQGNPEPLGFESETLMVKDTKCIGGSYSGEGRPIDVYSHRAEEVPERTQRVGEYLGYPINGIVQIDAACNGPEDHRILGELSLALARRLGGWIDYGGLLIRSDAIFDFRNDAAKHELAGVPAVVRVGWTGGGHLIAVRYQVGDGSYSY